MIHLPFVADRATWEDAARLMTRFGQDAGSQAAARADHSRDLGNMRHFCRWRQIERLIIHLADDGATAAIH